MNKTSFYLVGDSISIDYHPVLTELLAGGYGYRRKGGLAAARRNLDLATGANGGDSACVLAHLREMLAEGLPEEVVAVNCGLHDIKRNPDSGEIQVSQEEYRKHLQQIVALLQAAGKRMLWIRTTPVDEVQHRKCNGAFHRFEADLAAYNAIADAVMEEAGVDSIDLSGFTASIPGPWFRDHVHFFPEISRAQAGFLRRAFDRLLRPGQAPLHTFLGDSITDAGRERGDCASLGEGYVQCLAERLPHWRFCNLGVSGNRISDLRARLAEVPLESHSLTIYGGINDVVHLFKRNRPQSLEEFEADAAALLEAAQRMGIPLRVMLPFLCEARPVDRAQDWWPLPGGMYQAWRAALEARLRILEALCSERGIPAVPLDPVLGPCKDLCEDGIHPQAAGHALIAGTWAAFVCQKEDLSFTL